MQNGVPVDTSRYQRLVGKLIYLSHTQPDTAFAISMVGRFMHSPCEKHLEVVFRILRYSQVNTRKKVCFPKK